MSSFLVGSRNAIERFGLIGSPVSPTTNSAIPIPKMTDMWYLELYTNSGNQTNVYSRSVKTVSEVQIDVTNASFDQYGKRVYVPQRVDFSPVTLTLYDTVDGKIFDLVSEIYEYGFKNNTNKTVAVDTAISDHTNYGLKNKDGIAPQPQNNYFTQINIYHFINLSPDSKKHKISLFNPLITNFSFSTHDYSTSELRTISLTLQPENVTIDSQSIPNMPEWIYKGVKTLNEVNITNTSGR